VRPTLGEGGKPLQTKTIGNKARDKGPLMPSGRGNYNGIKKNRGVWGKKDLSLKLGGRIKRGNRPRGRGKNPKIEPLPLPAWKSRELMSI